MKKLEKRALICIFFSLIFVLGLGLFVFKMAKDGGKWAAHPGNLAVYKNGYITKGSIYDRNDKLLLKNTKKGKPKYNKDIEIREATLHTVGDPVGNIATGANRIFADIMIGYNFFTGTYSQGNSGRKITLTIDAEVCKTASQALAGRKGTVGVYNYETGEIICMVSAPTYDPLDPPKVAPDDTSGMYLNKLTASKVVPGSIFKILTSNAAIENLDDLDNFEYYCKGSMSLGDAAVDTIRCVYPHGQVDFKKALAVSCNCAFAVLSIDIGKGNLKQQFKNSGLPSSYDINGMSTIPSSAEFPNEDVTLAWTGIGQYNDLVNPASMMVYMGAIAKGGVAAEPRIIQRAQPEKNIFENLPDNPVTDFFMNTTAGVSGKKETQRLVNESTAVALQKMMKNNVKVTYGKENFPGLKIYAKSGTAELGSNKEPHSWFSGFIKNGDYPLAFIVLVENSGTGNEVAGRVTNTVLQDIVN
ncbi:MAG: penicillin-binding transpeptidase domain-containing protein [Anaerovoracaceae bacterium]